jgi:hypothetical protein
VTGLLYYFNDVDERGRPRWASGALGAWAIVLAGCVAPIEETRLEGPARPEPDARSVVTLERRAGADGAVECREVAATAPMVREVEIRRSFADRTQDRNGALALLLGAGVGVLAYSGSQVHCSQGGACGAPMASADVLLGLAAIPLGFLAYNAVAARDSRIVERVAPEVKLGAWRVCPE